MTQKSATESKPATKTEIKPEGTLKTSVKIELSDDMARIIDEKLPLPKEFKIENLSPEQIDIAISEYLKPYNKESYLYSNAVKAILKIKDLISDRKINALTEEIPEGIEVFFAQPVSNIKENDVIELEGNLEIDFD